MAQYKYQEDPAINAQTGVQDTTLGLWIPNTMENSDWAKFIQDCSDASLTNDGNGNPIPDSILLDAADIPDPWIAIKSDRDQRFNEAKWYRKRHTSQKDMDNWTFPGTTTAQSLSVADYQVLLTY